jgi:uncharacterized membrane protein
MVEPVEPRAPIVARGIPRRGLPLHPAHAILLAFPVAMFPAALLADIAYLASAEMQWSTFAAWLITGGLLFGAPVLLWSALIAFRWKGPAAYVLSLAIMWLAGLVNAFQHSRDGWSSVGTTGLILSIVSTLAVLAAAWIVHAAGRTEVRA